MTINEPDELRLKEINLRREMALREFKERGYYDKLKNLGIEIDEFNFIVKTPLHKNKNAVGINRNHFAQLRENKRVLILAIKNALNLKSHDFCVFDANNSNDTQFLSGYTGEFQFLNFRLNLNIYLRNIDDYVSQFHIKHEDLRTLSEFLMNANNNQINPGVNENGETKR